MQERNRRGSGLERPMVPNGVGLWKFSGPGARMWNQGEVDLRRQTSRSRRNPISLAFGLEKRNCARIISSPA